ncbi:ABC transporter permease [Nocardioides panaciterrulae]|uniref:ABC-type transport system involved in multi-copper enzyme maturation permease subunit n=1 Tax=Nocardioides panaciterrulae TaxID=661492 RepID=A0A7Y9E321_9ACTN|nr:ABC transporter permease [Nocardioides panaciterrulae]NYD40199.1 ABC-type transport system involved in multi-copper enzyme maturation permease subunit [Nocardioides panaciterrulae]
MTSTTLTPETAEAARPRAVPGSIPLSRLVAVEARKSFDTRSGLWLLASIAILAVLATAATILFAPADQLDYEAFASAIGFPMAVVLPMIAVLSVASEWSQRTGLTSFTLVPHRGRVITAKLVVTLAVGVVSMLLAAVIGAVGNLVGPALRGTDPVWNLGATELAYVVLGNVLGMLVGFMLGVLVRNSAAAIVGYFVYGFVLPPLSMLLAANQHWFAQAQPWVDFNFAQGNLFNDAMGAAQWAQLGVTGLVWLALPLAVGLRVLLRSEVK